MAVNVGCVNMRRDPSQLVRVYVVGIVMEIV
jgi:hypothetical protein